jgi:hypothetical protein
VFNRAPLPSLCPRALRAPTAGAFARVPRDAVSSALVRRGCPRRMACALLCHLSRPRRQLPRAERPWGGARGERVIEARLTGDHLLSPSRPFRASRRDSRLPACPSFFLAVPARSGRRAACTRRKVNNPQRAGTQGPLATFAICSKWQTSSVRRDAARALQCAHTKHASSIFVEINKRVILHAARPAACRGGLGFDVC